MGQWQDQELPVKVYRSRERISVAAPMPGLEPQDIIVALASDGVLTLSGGLRGHFKGQKEVLQDEWNPGPYWRSVQLDVGVDGTTANATYNNGVLVVSLPISGTMHPSELRLDKVTATEGRHAGNSGKPPRPTHVDRVEQALLETFPASDAPAWRGGI